MRNRVYYAGIGALCRFRTYGFKGCGCSDRMHIKNDTHTHIHMYIYINTHTYRLKLNRLLTQTVVGYRMDVGLGCRTWGLGFNVFRSLEGCWGLKKYGFRGYRI